MRKCAREKKNVFACARGRHTQHGPGARSHVLGATSLWLVAPVSMALRRGVWRSPRACAIMAWTAVTCAVSTLRFAPPPARQSLVRLDRTCARVQFALLLALAWVEGADGGRRGPMCAGVCFFPVVVTAGYAASRALAALPLGGTVAHLLFRFVGYWWTVDTLLPPYGLTAAAATVVVCHSALYWGHAATLFCRHRRLGALPPSYSRGCVEVLALAAACSTLQA